MGFVALGRGARREHRGGRVFSLPFPARPGPTSTGSIVSTQIFVGISIMRVSNPIVRACYSENGMFQMQ